MEINTNLNIHELVIIASIFVVKDDKVLMIRRSNEKIYLPGYVQPIGGKVDLDEDPLSAAHRELFEEAQIVVSSTHLKAVVTEIKSKKDETYKTNWQIFHFVGDYNDSPSNAVGNTNEGELVWLTLEEIKKEKIADSIRFIIDDVLKENQNVIFAKYIYGKDNKIIDKGISIV